MSALLEAAVAYAQAGYEVFPLRGKLPHANCPECNPKSPRYRAHKAADCTHQLCHGLLAATTDLERVTRWWTRWPQDNIGARVPRELLVLDVDPRNHGDATLDTLEDTHGPLPPTRTSWSGRGDGGRHLWFLHPGGTPSAARLGPGLDIKTHAGYAVLPPSRHPATNRPYRWDRPLLDPAPVPPWLVRLLFPPARASVTHRTRVIGRNPQGYWEKAVADELRQLADEGGHVALTRAAFRLGQLAHLGTAEDEVIEALAEAALIKANPPKSHSAALRTAAECFATGKANPRMLADAR